MPNPDGHNAFGGPFEHEQPYGAIEKLKSLARLAPTAQPTAVNAPRRSQRHATGQDKPGRRRGTAAAPAAASVPETTPEIPYETHLAQFWGELAASPGASPLLREIAGGLGG